MGRGGSKLRHATQPVKAMFDERYRGSFDFLYRDPYARADSWDGNGRTNLHENACINDVAFGRRLGGRVW